MKNKLLILSLSGLILGACSNESSSYEQELEDAKSEIDNLNSQLSEADSKILNLESDNQELKNHVEEYRTELENSLVDVPTDSSQADTSNLKEVPLGETIYFDDKHEVTVSDIYITTEEPNSTDIIQNNFVRVDFSFLNGESESLFISGDNAIKLYDSNDIQAKMTSKNSLFQEVAPGEKIETSVYYDAGQAPYRVVVGDVSWLSE